MSDFPIQPLFDKVLVKKDDATMDKDNVFYLPDTVKGRTQTGTVVAIGPGYLDLVTGKFIPTTLKVGDRIFIKEFDGYIIQYKEHKVFVFNEKDILGKLAEGE
ncbi:MAG: co-chaperone GroES [Patescibacteria group bacterium]